MKKGNKKVSRKQKLQEVEQASGNYAGAIGRGILAGLFGTAVMTVAQMIEMKLSGRKASTTPYKAVKKITGIEVPEKEDKMEASNIIHWAYGTSWGIPRGIMAETGMNDAASYAAHFGAVWGAALVMLPALKVAKPVSEWEPKDIAKDAAFHALYAAAVGFAADKLTEWAHAKNKK